MGRVVSRFSLVCVARLGLAMGLVLVATAMPGPVQAREVVAYSGPQVGPGTIVIMTGQRRLYLVLGQNRALRYPVGVGRAGMQWSGRTYIDGKYVKPAWTAPPSMRRDPSHPAPVIPGGSPRNPMGAAALTLDGGDYAIHGTNRPGSIGRFASHGCIRMYNSDIVDLYRRVGTGTPVVVLR